jgi:DNA-binding beta-propeller fold protein YncE
MRPRLLRSPAIVQRERQRMHRAGLPTLAVACLAAITCGPVQRPADIAGGPIPLTLVADVPLPGGSTRFDYQDIDPVEGHLVVAHMNDDSVVISNLRDGAVVKELKNIRTARGIAVAPDAGLIFVTSSPNQLVLIDNHTLAELKRVQTGRSPDGVAWDPMHKMVGVSDQADGALSIIPDAGSGARKQVALGDETGNVVYDPKRGWFWITVVGGSMSNSLVAVDPTSAKVRASIDLPGCRGAHGVRLHPDGESAFIACESNDTLAHVALSGAHEVHTGKTGEGPDVLALDPDKAWLYVAAESGDLTVFDLSKSGVVRLGREYVGDNAHSVAVDPATHRVFFPLTKGPHGKPVLRIMRPTDPASSDAQSVAGSL